MDEQEEQQQQLLPHVVDGLASSRPDELYAQIPKSYTSYAEGYRSVSWSQLANAINGVAWLLSEQLGTSETFETLAYFGTNDIGYMVVILGAAKAGYSVLLPSPTLNLASHISLLETAKCKTILTLAPPYAPSVEHILTQPESAPRVVHIPTIYELLDASSPHFAYDKTYGELQDKPLVMVHTSGTTGFPKPLIYTHKTGYTFGRELRAPPPDGHYNALSMIQTRRVLTAFPFFHSGAVMVALFIAIHSRSTLVIPLAGVPLSAANIVEVLRHVDVDSLCLPAPFVDQIAKNAEWFEFVTSRVKEVGYSGADIRETTGEAFVRAGFRLANFYGSSETLTTHTIRPQQGEPADAWHCMQPHPYVNAHFEPHGDHSGTNGGSGGDDDLFQLFWHRNPDPARIQPVFTIFPHLDRWPTRDLFSPHPSHPGMWQFRGRADDMVTGASGELTNPLAFEQRIAGLPEVSAALVVGEMRWQKALLIEPASSSPPEGEEAREAWIDRIWPSIEEANRFLSGTSRIVRSHVLLTDPALPMQRTPKGTVQRGPTVKLYAAQLEELYQRRGDGSGGSDPAVAARFPVHLSMHA